MVREMVADPSLADDLSQQTLEVGLRHDLSRVQNLRSWFRGVAKNLLRQSHRSQTRRERREQKVSTPDGGSEPPLPELMERVEIQQKVASAVLELPQQHRRVLILRYYEQHSVSQIAEAFGISNSAAGLRIHRAKSMLRNRLQSQLGGDWRVLAAPISGSIGKIGLATASAFAMNKLAKATLVLFVGLLCSLPFISNDDKADVDVSSQFEAELQRSETSSPNKNVLEEIEAKRNSISSSQRDLVFEGYTLKLIDSNQQPIPNAEVALHLTHNGIRFKNLHHYPDSWNPPNYPILKALTNDIGVAQIPYSAPEAKGYVFTKKDGFVLRGFPVAEFGKRNGPMVDLGSLVLNSDAGFCWLQFREESGALAADLEVDCKLRTTPDGLPSTQTPNGTIVFQSDRTDANGMVKFFSMPQGKVHLQIRSRRHVTWTDEIELETKPPQQPIPVTVSRGESIQLKVLDAKGAPVSNAGIHYTTNDWHRPLREMVPGTFMWRGSTNDLGEFSLEGSVEGQGHREVEISGNAWVEERQLEVGDTVVLQLPQMAELKGEVQLEDGRPAAGAKIAIVDFHRRRNDPDQIIEVDSGGRFSIPLPYGVYFYEAIHPDGSLFANEPVTVDQHLKPLNLTIPEGEGFSFTCVDKQTGLPIDGARGYFPRIPEHLASKDPKNSTTYFNRFRSQGLDMLFKDGFFTSSQLAPGTYTIQIDAIGYAGTEHSFQVEEGKPNDFQVELNPVTTLNLLALDADGTPQPGWRVMLVPKGSEPTWFLGPGERHDRYAMGLTNRDGVAEFESNLVPGIWRIESGNDSFRGWVFGELEIDQGPNTHSFVLPRNIEAEFQVLADGAPVPDARIDLRWHYPEEMPIFSNFPTGSITASNGFGKIRKLVPGEYRMDVRAPGLIPRSEVIRLEQDSQLIQIEYSGIRVEGRIEPVREQAKVVLLQITDASKWSGDISAEISRMFAHRSGIPSYFQGGCSYVKTEVDMTGAFVFPHVADGEYFVFAIVPEGVPPYPVPITISGQNRSDLQLQTPQFGRLMVNLIGLNKAQLNSPKARVNLQVNYDDLDPYYLPAFFEDTRRVIRGFREGECELIFEFRDPQDWNGSLTTYKKTVRLAVDQTSEINVDLEDFTQID